MATAKKRKTIGAPVARPRRFTTSFDAIQTVHASQADVDLVLVTETKKRDEVCIRSRHIVRMVNIGRFGFMEYHPALHTHRVIRIFVDDEDTGTERRNTSAALVYAVTHHAMSDQDLGTSVGDAGPDTVPFLAEAVCRLIGVANQ